MVDEDLLSSLALPLKELPGDYCGRHYTNIKGIPVTQKLTEELIREWFGHINPEAVSDIEKTWCCQITKKMIRSSYEDICHANFKNHSQEGWLACGSMFFETADNEKEHSALVKWINSEIFPWKAVVPYLTPLYNYATRRQTGYLISKEGMESLPFTLIKNFCIFLRMVSEKPEHIRTFRMLAEKGLDPRDAFYVAGTAAYHDSDTSPAGFYPYNNFDSGHWPITDNSWGNYDNDYYPQAVGGQFDFSIWFGKKDFRESTFSGSTINYIWMKPKERGYQIFSPKATKTKNYTSYNPDIDDVIKQYNEWKEKNVKQDY